MRINCILYLLLIAITTSGAQNNTTENWVKESNLATFYVQNGKLGCSIGNYTVACAYDSIRVEITPGQITERKVFQLMLNGKWTTIYLNNALELEESVRLHEPIDYHSYCSVKLAKKHVIYNEYTGMGNEITEPYFKLMPDGTRLDSVVMNEEGVVFSVYPPRTPSVGHSGVYDLKEGKWLFKPVYTYCTLVGKMYIATKINLPVNNDSLLTVSVYDLTGTYVIKNSPLNVTANSVKDMEMVTGCTKIKAVEAPDALTHTGFFIRYPIKITFVSDHVKMFDLASLQWLENE